jgi:hypothetical protein
VQPLVHVLVLVVEALFFAGLAGSAVVVVLSFVEDLSELFSDDEPTEPHRPSEAAHR